MNESELIYNLFYILLCFCIIHPPTEFISLGWTIDNLFSRLLGSEELNFIRYHQRRTALTLFIHTSLPGLYFLIYYMKFTLNNSNNDEYQSDQFNPKMITWNVSQRLSIFAIYFICAIICYWSLNNWENHPISKELLKFSNTQQLNRYYQIAIDIDHEFRRANVLKMKINSISSIIATENWVIKTTPYFVYFAHQSDTTLNVNKSETFQIAADTNDLLQMINIVVKPLRLGVNEFHIRINALDFKTLQDRIKRPITIESNIHFHRNLIDRFIEVFKEQVSLNPTIRINQISDNCFACMIAEPNVKIQKQCTNVDDNGEPLSENDCCKNCYCRPMWCIECLARWFASRQNEFDRDIWLQKKCTCPLCRAKFCILDVCYIEKINNNAL